MMSFRELDSALVIPGSAGGYLFGKMTRIYFSNVNIILDMPWARGFAFKPRTIDRSVLACLELFLNNFLTLRSYRFPESEKPKSCGKLSIQDRKDTIRYTPL